VDVMKVGAVTERKANVLDKRCNKRIRLLCYWNFFVAATNQSVELPWISTF